MPLTVGASVAAPAVSGHQGRTAWGGSGRGSDRATRHEQDDDRDGFGWPDLQCGAARCSCLAASIKMEKSSCGVLTSFSRHRHLRLQITPRASVLLFTCLRVSQCGAKDGLRGPTRDVDRLFGGEAPNVLQNYKPFDTDTEGQSANQSLPCLFIEAIPDRRESPLSDAKSDEGPGAASVS